MSTCSSPLSLIASGALSAALEPDSLFLLRVIQAGLLLMFRLFDPDESCPENAPLALSLSISSALASKRLTLRFGCCDDCSKIVGTEGSCGAALVVKAGKESTGGTTGRKT